MPRFSMQKISIIIFLISLFWAGPALAQDEKSIQVTPFVIDEKAKASDIFNYEVKIKNISQTRYDLYPVVSDIDMSSGTIAIIEPARVDKTTSITRWLTFKRGVLELNPGDEQVVPLEIKVNKDSKPGKYYASIAFPAGPNRAEAEANMAKQPYTRLIINIEVEEDIVEKANIVKFRTLRNIFFEPPIVFEFEMNNTGNNPQIPTGAIYIQDRKGIEVKKLLVNETGESVAAASTKTYQIKWDDVSSFGKFKARLELEYGSKVSKDLNDATFFWVFPWKIVIAFATIMIILIISLTLLIFYRTRSLFHEPPKINNPVINLKNHKL